MLDKKLEPICVTTGTKCLPKSKFCKEGTLVMDCHAEILAQKAL